MNEEKIIRKQLLQNMLHNLIAFTIIFTIFGAVIYSQVKFSVYANVERELLNYGKTEINIRTKGLDTGQRTIIMNEEILGPGKKINGEPPFSVQVGQLIGNPKVIYILRDEDGNVINAATIGRIYEDYLSNIKFDSNNTEKIYDLRINDQFNFKGITYENRNMYDEPVYIQLLVNVDSEVHILNNLLRILVVGTACAIGVAIAASYILSKRSLIPVVAGWKKQIEFTQNASHELRTPLTVMQLKQEHLLKEPNSTILEKSDEINITLDEIGRLTKLTTDLMTLARADSNTQEIKKEKINVDELIQEISKPYQEFAEVQEKKITLNLNANKELMLDRNKIHQLMIILLDNAIKYTVEGDSIEIATYIKDNHCNIEVKDTGIGISEEGRQHIFDRFYREDKARNRENGGTGLGLAIAHWIVTVHDGTIKALKNEPKGTIILIKLKS